MDVMTGAAIAAMLVCAGGDAVAVPARTPGGRLADAIANPVPGHPRLRLKIALHTGTLLVGNIGAHSRMNYTVIGDTVNTCSRIESLCGACDDGAPAIILASDDTMARIKNAGIDFVSAGEFEVKGRREPVRVSRLFVDPSPKG